MIGKRAFLNQLTAIHTMHSLKFTGTAFEGSSPSVFIGRENYPYVSAGPMLAQSSESTIYDTPERWLGTFQRDEIINLRLQLLRGKQKVDINDIECRFTKQLQDVALAKRSVLTRAEFEKTPAGVTFSEDHQPFGPSAALKHFESENVKWQKDLEKAYYDTDLLSKDAIIELYSKGIEFSSIQKALSTGAFGLKHKRKLVPTRWSITATDDVLGKHAMADVRKNEPIKDYRVYESDGLNNYYAVMLTPTKWQYEAIEAFIDIIDKKTFAFSDAEGYLGRNTYSEMGGCYYAQRQVIAEQLKKRQEQAGAFVFREVTPGYIPTGVWVCRELTRNAMQQTPKSFKTKSEAMHYIETKLRLGMNYYTDRMTLVNAPLQKTLGDF